MIFVLVPGFWLGAESWSEVTPYLDAAGIEHRTLTLPGLERHASNAGSIRLTDHIEAVHAAIHAAGTEVILVGHSAAGPICHAAAARAVDRVRRIVHVDTWPLSPGLAVNADMTDGADVIELPNWSEFEPEDLVDMTDVLRERLRRESRPQPAAIARDPFPTMDERRFSIPTTVICCEFTSQQLGRWVEAEPERFAELRRLTDVTYLDLPTGHWPQFTKPRELAHLLTDLR